jgi:hypothetical protein
MPFRANAENLLGNLPPKYRFRSALEVLPQTGPAIAKIFGHVMAGDGAAANSIDANSLKLVYDRLVTSPT